VSEYLIEQVTPSLYALAVWDEGWHSFNNCYVVRDGGHAILIDSGKTEHAPVLEEALHELGLNQSNITAVIVTHGHHDHVGGALAAGFAKTPKHIHPADKRLLPETVRDGWHADLPSDGNLFGLRCVLLGQHTLGSVALFHPPTHALFWGDHLCFFGAPLDDEGLVCFGASRRDRVLRNVAWRKQHWPPDEAEQDRLRADLACRAPEDQQRHNFPLAIEGFKRVISSMTADILCTGHGPVLRGDVASFLEQVVEAAGA
jgi:flavorubredoxin